MPKKTAAAGLDARGAAHELGRLGHLHALRNCMVAARDQALQRVHEGHDPAITKIESEIQALENSLAEFGLANPPATGRTIVFSTGEIRLRTGPRKLVFLYGWDEDRTLHQLLCYPAASQWHQYVRHVYEIDRARILRDTDDSPGKTPVFPEPKLRDIGLRVTRQESAILEPCPQIAALDVPCP